MKYQIEIDGDICHVETDDQYIACMGEDFEPHMVTLFKSLISPDFVIADIGANIGLTSILFSKLCSKVVSFEPSPSTYRILTKNLEINNIKNVLSVNAGLGDKNETSTITFASNMRSGGFISDQVRPIADHTTESITIKRLDDVWSDYDERLDFVKIDVEGFEGHVIKGAKEVLKKYKPTVVLELNHWCLNAFRNITVPVYFELLRGYFPFLYAVDGDNKTIMDLHDSDQAYHVMYEHILKFRFPNIVAGFDETIRERLNRLKGVMPV